MCFLLFPSTPPPSFSSSFLFVGLGTFNMCTRQLANVTKEERRHISFFLFSGEEGRALSSAHTYTRIRKENQRGAHAKVIKRGEGRRAASDSTVFLLCGFRLSLLFHLLPPLSPPPPPPLSFTSPFSEWKCERTLWESTPSRTSICTHTHVYTCTSAHTHPHTPHTHRHLHPHPHTHTLSVNYSSKGKERLKTKTEGKNKKAKSVREGRARVCVCVCVCVESLRFYAAEVVVLADE